jgi:kynurenine formamidase
MSNTPTAIRTPEATEVPWELAQVTSPHLANPAPVIAAKGIPYRPNANRLQNLSLYLPKTPQTASLMGTPANSLPEHDSDLVLPRYHVHIHGGAWRDPDLTSASIEPAVALSRSRFHGDVVCRFPSFLFQ